MQVPFGSLLLQVVASCCMWSARVISRLKVRVEPSARALFGLMFICGRASAVPQFFWPTARGSLASLPEIKARWREGARRELNAACAPARVDSHDTVEYRNSGPWVCPARWLRAPLSEVRKCSLHYLPR